MYESSALCGKRLLIVDDEAGIRALLIHALKRQGCIVSEASCGHEALEIVKHSEFDGIISDIRMANGTGIDLLEKVRARYPHLPIVMLMTGYAEVTESETLKKGAVALVQKPFDTKGMISQLSAVFASKP